MSVYAKLWTRSKSSWRRRFRSEPKPGGQLSLHLARASLRHHRAQLMFPNPHNAPSCGGKVSIDAPVTFLIQT